LIKKDRKAKGKFYSITGDIVIETKAPHEVAVQLSEGVELPLDNPDLYIDYDENGFYKGYIEVKINGTNVITLLRGGEVEIFCRILGVLSDKITDGGEHETK